MPHPGARIDLFLDSRRVSSCCRQNRRRGRRSKADIERDRQARLERTMREIDEIYQEYLSQLGPGAQLGRKGVAYARFSTRFQDSIGDQIRTILGHALKIGVYVPRELIFFDLAVRGFKKNRTGLDAVEKALRSKQASVLLLFSTSRLFRKQYRTLEFVDRVHKGWAVRCVFVKSGVDTDDTQRWQSILAVQSMIDQFVVTMYVANIHSAHEGLLKQQMVFGTLSYGYTGEPIDGELTNLGRPRCKIIIDEETARIVRQIFEWFVNERVSIETIVQRLNDDPQIPLPPRAISGMWTRVAVINILTNTRYRGFWRYGATEAIYIPDGDYVAQRLRAEPLAAVQIEELRLVPDALWLAAQVRLTDRAGRRGRHSNDGNRRTRPKLLNGLLKCAEHQQHLYVSGAHGNAMHCPVCKRLSADTRPLYTLVNRMLATELICQTIAELVSADPELPAAVMQACAREAEAARQPDSARLAQLEARIKQIERGIEFTRTNVGDTDEDQLEARRTIAAFQQERAELRLEIEQLANARKAPPRQPTEAEVKAMIADLGSTLVAAAESDDEAEVARARHLIEIITGGRIDLYQMGERRKHGGWLQAKFTVSIVPYLVELAIDVPPAVSAGGTEIVVDLRRPHDDSELEEARRLANQGLIGKQIAQQLGWGRSKVTKLLKAAAAKYGEEYVDGRTRRATLPKKSLKPRLHEQLADAVMERLGRGVYRQDIAAELKVSVKIITDAIRWWHEQRGLPAPDGRYKVQRDILRQAANENRREAG